MAVAMKITAFWDVMPRTMEEVHDVSKENAASIVQNDDGGNRFLLNVHILLPNYMTSHPRKQQTSRVHYDL
jgi:hypothetical protein